MTLLLKHKQRPGSAAQTSGRHISGELNVLDGELETQKIADGGGEVKNNTSKMNEIVATSIFLSLCIVGCDITHGFIIS